MWLLFQLLVLSCAKYTYSLCCIILHILYEDAPEGLVGSEFTPQLPTLEPSKYDTCILSVTVEQQPLVTTQCESSSGVPAASKDICHKLETTASTLYSTQTVVPSTMALSKSERKALQVPHSEKGTGILLRRDGTKLLFQEQKIHIVFSSTAPMEENATEQREGESGTREGEATSTQAAGAIGS